MSGIFDISGKVVAMTGAGGVLYSTVSRALASNGAAVALLDIDGPAVEELAKDISDRNGKALAVECDVLDRTSVENALTSIVSELGSCSALINGAGGNRKGASVGGDQVFTDIPTQEIEKVFELNYMGTVIPSQVFCRYFAETGKGIIVNTTSMCALQPLTNVGGYSNAKAALTNFTRWLAVQVKVDFPDADIRVNEIAPGFFDTTQNHSLLFEKDGGTLTVRGHSIIGNTPMGRFGKPEELVGPLVMMLSEAGSFLHGVTLCVDGGFNVYSGVGPLDEKR
jgi:NAD(P)-dependent dehydrogenase (short-subunit alcohol dehydrogenase family)